MSPHWRDFRTPTSEGFGFKFSSEVVRVRSLGLPFGAFDCFGKPTLLFACVFAGLACVFARLFAILAAFAYLLATFAMFAYLLAMFAGVHDTVCYICFLHLLRLLFANGLIRFAGVLTLFATCACCIYFVCCLLVAS